MTPSQTSPLILITNDDGIDSPWLGLLAEELRGVGEVIVSAPETEQSAVGNSISLNSIIRITERGDGQFAVAGTPTDAVLLGMSEFCPRKPDLVVSGINPGPNLGTDVFYSGTVAGAIQGAIREVPGMAVSQELPGDGSAAVGRGPSGGIPEEQAARLPELMANTAAFARDMARRLLASPLPPNTVLNLNGPACVATDYAWTRMGRRIYRENILRRLDPRDRPYYWIGGPPIRGINPPGTDGHAVEGGLFSLTLLSLDLTAGGGEHRDWQQRFEAPGEPWAQVEDVALEPGQPG